MGSSKERKEAEEATAVAVTKKEKKDKKEKKEKKEKKRSETDGVHKSKDKSDKKEKKQKKEKLVQALDAHLQAEAAKAQDEEASATVAASESTANVEMTDAASKPKKAARAARPIVQGALVEFAKPLATDKYQKKVFKTIKKAAQNQALLRGIKEVNKALRKSPAKTPTTSGTAKISGAGAVPGIVVIAGDVNPAEVIMHLPLACEDVNVPYVFVASRGELGQAARTKRPTSVVMLKAEGRPAKKDKAAAVAESDDEEGGNSYPELYQELVKLAQKEYATQMAGII